MSTELQFDSQTQAGVLGHGTLRYPTRPPNEGLRSVRLTARSWAESLNDHRHLFAVRRFMTEALGVYAKQVEGTGGLRCSPKQPPEHLISFPLDFAAVKLAATTGQAVGELNPVEAADWLSATYTAMLPDSLRSKLGIYYTPPALSARLLDMASNAGVDWATCTVLDPSCGGGAFLGPAALRMANAQRGQEPAKVVASIAQRLRGFEIDPFAAWLSQAFLEIVLADLCTSADIRLPQLVQVCDSLALETEKAAFDLVIGNPPYGRVRLSPKLRRRYRRSLYGHANLYGVFTELALRWCAPRGVIAYLTPTSFLAGEYFKALRALLTAEAPPISVDFVEARRGVFEDVLQETMLATYRRSGAAERTAVHHVAISSSGDAFVSPAGNFSLPDEGAAPWLLPRHPSHAMLVARLAQMTSRLVDWGYEISTGPLVWNRHKNQLRRRSGKGCVPLVWSEAIAAPGRLVFRAEKKNHEPYFRLEDGDDWLRIIRPCVLLKRTTAKEQDRRLFAAVLPEELIAEHGGVVVENHLNMVRAFNGSPEVSLCALTAVLNSKIVDLAFRCISGSVAVSAYELRALPLPSIDQMPAIERLVAQRAGPESIERHLKAIYLGENP